MATSPVDEDLSSIKWILEEFMRLSLMIFELSMNHDQHLMVHVIHECQNMKTVAGTE